MNNWRKVKLGKILSESKIEAPESNADSRIRVLLNTNGVIKRPLTKETKGATNYFTRSEGQFIYGKQNLHKGAFGIVPKELDGFTSSSDLPAFDVVEYCLPEWLDYFLKQGDFYLSLIDIAKGAATKRIQPKALFEVKIPLPDTIEEQQKIIDGFKNKEKTNSLLKKEIQTQKQLISQLKQSILQEAIQGKLTQEWRERNPNTESASKLLERIKTEKKQLIKNKKIRKEKPLPPITKEEIPFELPENWVWCRLLDLCEKTGSGSTPRGGKSAYINSGIKFIRSQNVYDDELRTNGIAFISEKVHEKMSGTKVEAEDLLLNITGGSIGRCCIVPKNFDTGNINQHVSIIRSVEKSFSYFLHKVICSNYFQKTILEVQTGAGREGLAKNKMDEILIPFPPEIEREAIVQKAETLLQKCNALEQEITQSEQHANMLMQAVLKEAFEGKAEQKTKVVKLNTKPTNIDYYKRTLLATEIVWQLHKEPTLGHLKLQKLMYLAQESGNMQLPTNFLQQVAGPYDPQMARSLDKQMKTKKWFEYQKTEVLKFKPLEKAGEHKTDFEKFFANEIDSIQYIIDTFKTAKSDQVEIVGTLYACWNKLIDEKQIVSDESLTKRFYEWSEEKAKFEKNRIIKALRWMETKGIVPEYANA